MIREAAYLKAEARNFAPGVELNDWLEAEKEVLARLRAPEPPQKGRLTADSRAAEGR